MTLKATVLALVSSALFLIVIDMTVLYTALPILTHDLHATATENYGLLMHTHSSWQGYYQV